MRVKRKMSLMMIILSLILGCESKEDGPKAKNVDNTGKNQNSKIVKKPRLRCNPCLWSPEEWGEQSDQAFPEEGQFWATDKPKKLERVAFGELNHIPLNIKVSIKQFKVHTELPTIPKELPVYMQGSYPSRHKELLKSFTPYHEVLDYHPSYSGIYFAGIDPITEKLDEPQQHDIENKAKEVLGKLLMPDSSPSTVQHNDGSWTVTFYRYINGYKVYVDKPIRIGFDKEGRVVSIAGRRKPIIEESYYPTRSPNEAIEDLLKGKWLLLDAYEFFPEFNRETDQFVITDIEIAYHEQQPFTSRQVMQPYYVFKNKEGQALYVPAIADPYTEVLN
ncbi:hypothetical protein DRW41_08635 [Neobacillus piezotolerans]|uniref:Lipoprotein n=1 Tax=Neobacillus piezotolerans TaxID=2259171 RepID=A0A3D8GU40_9BACI|nr:hypothetical protein [Neobacillus piezotolerans]RDU37872.1 hypothetical protein DRW41_08635 [Neobacillus piezotolerans]